MSEEDEIRNSMEDDHGGGGGQGYTDRLMEIYSHENLGWIPGPSCGLEEPQVKQSDFPQELH